MAKNKTGRNSPGQRTRLQRLHPGSSFLTLTCVRVVQTHLLQKVHLPREKRAGGNLTPDLIRATQCPLSGLVLVAVTCRQEQNASHTLAGWLGDILSVFSNVTNSKCAWLVKGDRLDGPSCPARPCRDGMVWVWVVLTALERRPIDEELGMFCSPKKTVMRPCMFHVHLSICQLIRETGPAI